MPPRHASGADSLTQRETPRQRFAPRRSSSAAGSPMPTQARFCLTGGPATGTRPIRRHTAITRSAGQCESDAQLTGTSHGTGSSPSVRVAIQSLATVPSLWSIKMRDGGNPEFGPGLVDPPVIGRSRFRGAGLALPGAATLKPPAFPESVRPTAVAHWCSLVCIRSTRASASTSVGHGAPMFTGDLLPCQPGRCQTAAALPHATGSPGLGVLRRLRHAPASSVDDEPARPPPGRWMTRARPTRFPRSPRHGLRARCPALPLRHRHEYAADLPRGLPTVHFTRTEVAHQQQACTADRPLSTRFEPAHLLRGVTRWFLTYTFSSR
jgi:hypothetical protein